jgi:hypothetical protein
MWGQMCVVVDGGAWWRARMVSACLLCLAFVLLVGAVNAQRALAGPDVCGLAFPHPLQVTRKIRFGTKTIYNQHLSRELVCSGSFGVPDGIHLSVGAECDIIAAVYGLADPGATDIGSVVCSLASAPTEKLKATEDALCGFLADAFGTGVGLFAAGVTADPVIGVVTWKGVTFFTNTAVCVGLADGGAKAWGYKHETDHEVAVARDIIRREECLQLTQQRVLGVSRLNWSAVACPGGFVSHDASPFRSPVPISKSGRIGRLRIGVSTAADITRALGRPGYTATGNVCGVGCGYPDYELFGYDCTGRQPQPAPGSSCVVNYYVSLDSHRLESFATTSNAFALPGGVRVGVSGTAAAERERQPDERGCGQAIFLKTPKLSIDLWTRGGRENKPPYVEGGRVVGIGIDDRKSGVGVLFC